MANSNSNSDSDSAAEKEKSLLPVFVATSLDTRLAMAASPHDTPPSLKPRLAALHLANFPSLGAIRIEALLIRREGTAFRLSDSMPVAVISGGTKGACFLEALVVRQVPVPNTDEECAIPLKQKTEAKKGKSKRVERTDIENAGWGENFGEDRPRKKAKVPASNASVAVGEPECINMFGENLRHDSDLPETPVERDVLDPSGASADSTLTPLKPVDEENGKLRALVDSTLVVTPEGSMCSKCASIFEELKKVKIRKNFLDKKLAVKVGTITELRKMLEEAENIAKGLSSRVLSLQSALSSSEERAREAEARLEEMERKWIESDMRAHKAEAKCAEADAMAHNAKMQLLDTDIRAQKSKVKACKFQVKLIEADACAQKANAELAKAEKRAHKLEEKLMEALERARSAEVKVTEIDAKRESKALDFWVEDGEATSVQAVALGRIKKEH